MLFKAQGQPRRQKEECHEVGGFSYHLPLVIHSIMIAMPTPQNVSIYFDKVEALKDFHEAEDFLSQVPAYLLDDKEFANICVTRFPMTLSCMSNRLRHDVDLAVMAINRNFCTGEALFDDVDTVYDSMPEDMKVNKELNIKLIEQDFWRPN